MYSEQTVLAKKFCKRKLMVNLKMAAEKTSLVEQICIDNKRWPWCTGKVRQDATILFRKEGLEINSICTNQEANDSTLSAIIAIVNKVCNCLECDISDLLRRTEVTTHPAHAEVLKTLVEQKTSVLCFSKALKEVLV